MSFDFDLIPAALEEFSAALQGRDWGYGALGEIIGDTAAKWVLDTVERLAQNTWSA